MGPKGERRFVGREKEDGGGKAECQGCRAGKIEWGEEIDERG